MSDVFASPPGEPAPVDDATTVPPAAANTDQPTGTPMDTAVDVPLDLSDPLAAGLAAYFESQSRFRDVAAAAAAPASGESAPTEPTAPATAPAATEPPATGPETPGTPQGVEGAVEGQADPASPPAPEPQPAPTGSSPSSPPATPESPAQPAPSASPVAPWVPEGHVLVGNRPIPQDEITNLVRVYDWAKSLPPETAQAIADLQSGNYVLTPRAAQPGTGSPASGMGGSPSSPPSLPTPGGGDAGSTDYLDPALAARVEQIAQQQAQLLAFQQQQAQQALAQQQAAFQAQVQSAQTTFASERGLSEPEIHFLVSKVGQMQMLPALVRENGGDITKGVQAALDAAYWATPDFRNRHTASDAQQQVDQTLLLNQQLQEKRARAAAASGTGAPVPRITPPSTAPLTREQASQGMVQEIANALSGSSNNGSN